jgi:hypothetical protein
MTAPPSLGNLLRWISHQRAMSCRTRLRADCDLGTLPVNVRTSRAPSLSMIRQCRKAKSKGSSFFSEKSTLKVDLGLVSVILPLHCVRPRGQSITRMGVPSVLWKPFWTRWTPRSRSIFLAWLPPLRAYPREGLDEPAPRVCNSLSFLPWFSCGLSASKAIRFLRQFAPVSCFGQTGLTLLQLRGS